MAMRSKKSLLEQSIETAKEIAATIEASLADGASLAEGAPEAAAEELPVVEAPGHRGRGWLKKLLLLGGLAAIGAVVLKKLRSGSTSDNWQSSYVPAPPPTATPTPAPAHATDDAGAGPDEAVSDASAKPHTPTTPDHPAEVVDIEESADKD